MCGFTGFYQSRLDGSSMVRVITRMRDLITHRGPDSEGIWLDEGAGLALGHRRLSILDLSSAGHQPMESACSRYVIVFNGEIYNHEALRRRLKREGKAPSWRGQSDTETLLASFAAWGIERCLQATVGMFAFALWDRRERRLTLARDRLGEKPLYYGWMDDVLLFGSELKALEAHPAFQRRIDRNALTLLLRHNCVPAPHSIYQGIFKLLPGHYLTLPLQDRAAARAARPQVYWNFNEVVERGLAEPFSGSDEEAVTLLEERLASSISQQMLADVPLGAFLSGGVDSSTVAALMQAQCGHPIRTFSIGLDEKGQDEAVHAKAVARHLGTQHTELYVQPEDARAVIPSLPTMYCEPFSDSSQIPTFLVSRMARQHVTVALSGDGGDELFGGYNRYLGACRVWSRMQRLPGPARHSTAAMLRALPPAAWDRLFALAKPLLPRRWEIDTPGEKAQKLAEVLAHADGQAFFRSLTSHWKEPSEIVIGAHEPQTLLSNSAAWPRTDAFEHWMMAMDAQTYMTDDILVKVDRAAMASSLETRVPFLDHRVVELAWRMPLDLKIRHGQGKWLLRQVLYRHVPRELIERPKMGFGIPLGHWLRGPLRDWAESLLSEHHLRQDGYFRAEPVRRMWADHLSGRRDWQYHLWDILMFKAWLQK
ncbi:asparagine synthase (glutamine-hydrolyzing) [Aidingimonas lacisalsi]|uniref:asparagine synthase (glutamine-hydrolyzing) n=1 Tax=Aidingimonas lacisalsi TaxID=2604086 RepID=UPI0011D27015|nr:asparagine synthase (glutamine-hydrolyzing) [Aidingimonas lacisalsi]